MSSTTMAVPDFIIGGAAKCGTTALWAQLDEHPQICMASQKEPRFFSRLEGELERGVIGDGQNRSGTFERGWDWYRGLFRDCAPGARTGEASTYYFAAEDSASLIREYRPDAKLVFLLRNPVDRVYSHYWEEHKLGWPLPEFGELVRTSHPRLSFYASGSHYATNIGRFRALFDDEQILIVVTEEMNADPHAAYASVCRFLGVDEAFVPSGLGKRFNEQRSPRYRSLARAVSALHGSALTRAMPESGRKLFGRMRRAINRANTIRQPYPALAGGERAVLADRFADDVAYIERLLGRTLPRWH